MGKQEIRQQARAQALGAAKRQRQAQVERDRRVRNLVVQVLTAIGERDAAVTQTERRAGAALVQLTQVEGLTLAQAVEWCRDELSVREATRLRRLSIQTATATTIDAATGDGYRDDGDDGDNSKATAECGERSEQSERVGPPGRVRAAAGHAGGVRADTPSR